MERIKKSGPNFGLVDICHFWEFLQEAKAMTAELDRLQTTKQKAKMKSVKWQWKQKYDARI